MPTQAVDVSESGDLDFEFEIDEVEYVRIMRRICIDGDETVTRVSAFNSSI